MADPRPIKQEIKAEADLAGLEQAEQGLKEFEQQTEKAARTSLDSAKSSEDQERALGELKNELRSLHDQEVRLQQRQERGVEITNEERRASKRREAQIEGLSRAIAEHRDRQDEVNRRVDRSIDSQRRAGRAMDNTTDAARRQGRGLGVAGEAVAGLQSRWLSFAAAGAGLITFMRELNETLDKQAESAREVGEILGGLSANIGGDLADDVLERVNKIALDRGLGLEGRKGLIEVLSASTDIDPNQDADTLGRTAERFADLQRGTGVGGAEAFGAVRALRANFGLDEQAAVNQAGVLFNAGLSPNIVEQLTERGAPVGGQDFLALLLAARGEVNLEKQGEAAQTLIEALTRRDQDGSLADELEAVGLTGDESLVERIQRIQSARSNDQISQAQFERAIGGAQRLRIFDPLTRALPRLDETRASLETGTIEEEIERRLKSEFVQAQESENRRQLQDELTLERTGAQRPFQLLNAGLSGVKDEGGGSLLFGATRATAALGGAVLTQGSSLGANIGNRVGQAFGFQEEQDKTAGGAPQTVIINSGPQYNNAEPELEGRREGVQQ